MAASAAAAAESVPGQVDSPPSSAANGHQGGHIPAALDAAKAHAGNGVDGNEERLEGAKSNAEVLLDRVTPVLQAMGASALAPLASHNVVVRPEDARSPPIGADGQADMWWFYQPWASARTVTQFISALILIWIFQFLYLGATWDPVQKLSGLEVVVLNCDAGVNSTVVQAMPAQLQPYASRLSAVPLATQLMSATVYNGSSAASSVLNWQPWTCNGSLAVGCGTPQQEAACYANLQEEILQGRQWAAWYWPSTTSLAHLSSFNVTGAAAALLAPPAQPVVLYQVYARGRNYSTYSYILLVLQSVAVAITQAFGLTIANSGVVSSGLFFPTSLVPPITVKQVDLAPVTFFGQNMACYVCCLLTWLGSAFCCALSSQHKLPVEMQALNATTPEKRPSFRKVFWALLIKATAAWVFMFTLSCLLVLCVMALGTGAGGGAQFDRNPGVAIAFIWWLSFAYLAVNSLLLHALGIEKFNSVSALLLILQLMSSGGILSEETSPGFYYVGRGLPFYYGVRGLRTIFFGTQTDSFWVDWVVLLGWNVGTSLLTWLFVANKVHKSGTTARPRMAPIGTVGDVALAGGI